MGPFARSRSARIFALTMAGAVAFAAEFAMAERLTLVLKSGEIIEGDISQSPGGYLIQKTGGSMLLPFDQVQLEALDKHDAYAKLRQTVIEDTPAGHLSLARWCMRHQLYDEAKRELEETLERAPSSAEAKLTLRRLEEIINPQAPLHETRQKSAAEAFAPPPAVSLAGLDQDTARVYTTRVQPLLLKKCGNASCHGNPETSDFELLPVRGGSRITSERNLAAVLKRIDVAKPDASDLLTGFAGNHGRGGRPVFNGPEADRQLKILQDWIEQVAARQNGEPAPTVQQKPKHAMPAGGIAWKASPFGNSPAPRFVAPDGPAAHAAVKTPSQQSAALRKALLEQRPDAFDPRAFNRMVHGSGEPQLDEVVEPAAEPGGTEPVSVEATREIVPRSALVKP